MKIIFCFFLSTILFLYPITTYSQLGWENVSLSTYENLNSVSFPSVSIGYIGGNIGKIWKSTNTGYTWSSLAFPNTSNILLVYFLNDLTGFASSQLGLYKTTDGGATWSPGTTPSSYRIISMSFTSPTNGWAGDTYGNILSTTNGGSSWVQRYLSPGYSTRVFFINDTYGWSVDTYGYLLRTTNGGTNFVSLRIATDTLSGIHFISSTIGYVVGDSGKVLKTTTGGTSWTLLNSGTTAKLKSIYVESPVKLDIADDGGNILQSADGGFSWETQFISPNALNQITFAPASSAGWVVGNVGTLAHRVNPVVNVCVGSGTTLAGYPFYTYYDDSRTDMLYLASEIVAAGGGVAGSISKIGWIFDSVSSQVMNGFNIKMQNTSLTTLSGFTSTNWTTVYSGTYTAVQGFNYLDLQTPFAYSQGSNLLIEVCFNNATWTYNSVVYSTSKPGMTYHGHADLVTTDGCISITTGQVYNNRPNICFITSPVTGNGNTNVNLPKEYKLCQNYPNPFNPVTKIKYDIVKSGNVNLKIYDILGKEVAALVNEQLQPGTYEIEWNASSFSSGVYFYKLTSGVFTDTKRMLLIK
jgi:photosystem II stability/assembly factor-like uncharacterized protein